MTADIPVQAEAAFRVAALQSNQAEADLPPEDVHAGFESWKSRE